MKHTLIFLALLSGCAGEEVSYLENNMSPVQECYQFEEWSEQETAAIARGLSRVCQAVPSSCEQLNIDSFIKTTPLECGNDGRYGYYKVSTDSVYIHPSILARDNMPELIHIERLTIHETFHMLGLLGHDDRGTMTKATPFGDMTHISAIDVQVVCESTDLECETDWYVDEQF